MYIVFLIIYYLTSFLGWHFFTFSLKFYYLKEASMTFVCDLVLDNLICFPFVLFYTIKLRNQMKNNSL